MRQMSDKQGLRANRSRERTSAAEVQYTGGRAVRQLKEKDKEGDPVRGRQAEAES